MYVYNGASYTQISRRRNRNIGRRRRHGNQITVTGSKSYHRLGLLDLSIPTKSDLALSTTGHVHW